VNLFVFGKNFTTYSGLLEDWGTRCCGPNPMEAKDSHALRMRKSVMILRKLLILRKLRSSCLEGRTAPIQQIFYSFTRSVGGMTTGTLRIEPRSRFVAVTPAGLAANV
jgi:hypothetical protein